MIITEADSRVSEAILHKDADNFIAAIESGASLISNITKRARCCPSNPQIQAMIEFVIALDAKGVERKVTAEYLRSKESAATFRLLASKEPNELPAVFEALKPTPPKHKGL